MAQETRFVVHREIEVLYPTWKKQYALLRKALAELQHYGTQRKFTPPEAYETMSTIRMATAIAVSAKRALDEGDALLSNPEEAAAGTPGAGDKADVETCLRLEMAIQVLRAELWRVFKAYQDVAHMEPRQEQGQDATGRLGGMLAARASAALGRAAKVLAEGESALLPMEDEPSPDPVAPPPTRPSLAAKMLSYLGRPLN